MSNTNEQVSRRDMIRWSALLSTGAVAAACNGSSTPGPDAGPDTSTGMDTGTGPDATADATGDAADANGAALTLLNALLSAEWAAVAAYGAGAGILSAPPSGDPLAADAPVFLAVAMHFQSQHMAHAAALAAAITSLGGTPVAQSSVTFTAPAGFTASVENVLKLAANAEKAAAIAYNATVPQLPLSTANLRFLAGSILGDETQHFIVLYALLQGVAAAGPNIATMTSAIVPTDFTSTVGTDVGLQSVVDFTFS